MEAKKVIEDLTSEEENNVSTPVVRVISLLEGFLSTPVEDEDEKKGYLPLSFYKEEVPRGSPNYKISLLVRDFTANFVVHKILVNQGSSCDIHDQTLGIYRLNRQLRGRKINIFYQSPIPSLYN
ncbi:unnamed protein product [Trifolium pratense]|uniref:Uncharacterized protein n=1 Tax=Trifolium pratense TaxID=57577 RepID=A0ACB0LQ76_TRIPR|nr:unnamed protein product [Trifolium pratense]